MDHRLKLVKFLIEKAKNTPQTIEDVYKNLLDNITVGKQGEGKGASAEHLMRLVHAVRSGKVAHDLNKDNEFIETFGELSQKRASESASTGSKLPDAIEFGVDASGKLVKKPIDVKLTTTKIYSYAPSELRKELGTEEAWDNALEAVRGAARRLGPKQTVRSPGQDPLSVLDDKHTGKSTKELTDLIRSQEKEMESFNMARGKIMDLAKTEKARHIMSAFMFPNKKTSDPNDETTVVAPISRGADYITFADRSIIPGANPATVTWTFGNKQIPISIPKPVLLDALGEVLPRHGKPAIATLQTKERELEGKKKTLLTPPNIQAQITVAGSIGGKEQKAIKDADVKGEMEHVHVDDDMLSVLRHKIGHNKSLHDAILAHVGAFKKSP
jgi:hypothetical protein